MYVDQQLEECTQLVDFVFLNFAADIGKNASLTQSSERQKPSIIEIQPFRRKQYPLKEAGRVKKQMVSGPSVFVPSR